METIDFTVDQGIAWLTLNRPERKNALNETMSQEITEVIGEVRSNPDIRVLVLQGAGGDFCSGGDIQGMKSMAGDLMARRSRMKRIHVWVEQLINLDKPVIAAVDGVAYGAGFGMALAADFVLATPQARFCMAFMKIGLIPDCAALYTLPRVVGLQRAKEIMFSARTVGAEEARQLGIVLEVHEREQMEQRVKVLAESMRGASSTAFSIAKRGLNGATLNDLQTMLEIEAAGQTVAFASSEHQEAIDRFLKKEPPLFSWPEG